MSVLKKLQHEFLLVLPPTIFFFMGFTLIAITQRLILREHGMPLTGFGAAAIGALVVGKVVLIVDKLPFMNKFPDRPLVFNIAWQSSIYFLATFLVRYIEHVTPLLREYGDFTQTHQHLLAEMVWPHFWLIQMWLSVLFVVFCTLSELVRAISKDEVIRLFLGTRANID